VCVRVASAAALGACLAACNHTPQVPENPAGNRPQPLPGLIGSDRPLAPDGPREIGRWEHAPLAWADPVLDLDGPVRRLPTAIVYHPWQGAPIRVPADYHTDGASFPQLVEEHLVQWDAWDDRWVRCAVIHDFLCDRRSDPYEWVHRIWVEMAVAGSTPIETAQLQWRGLDLGGVRWQLPAEFEALSADAQAEWAAANERLFRVAASAFHGGVMSDFNRVRLAALAPWFRPRAFADVTVQRPPEIPTDSFALTQTKLRSLLREIVRDELLVVEVLSVRPGKPLGAAKIEAWERMHDAFDRFDRRETEILAALGQLRDRYRQLCYRWLNREPEARQ
jgi:hypothetical protein